MSSVAQARGLEADGGGVPVFHGAVGRGVRDKGDHLFRFRAVGERKTFIDTTNAIRKSTYGALAELPHKHPEKNLANTFAESFFKRAARRKAAEDEPGTAAELTKNIAQVEERLATLTAKYTDVLAAEETEARGKAQREADAAALADAEKDAEAVYARVNALRAKLGR